MSSVEILNIDISPTDNHHDRSTHMPNPVNNENGEAPDGRTDGNHGMTRPTTKSTSKSPKSKTNTRTSKSKSEKTPKSRDDDSFQRRAEMEEKIRRRVALEEKAFRLVERLLDNPVTEDFLKEAGAFLSPDHYKDVTEERSIISNCGYPICNKQLPPAPKQKYHISTRSNKVYDITERKKFCSNQCYKASQYFEKQISTTPVWLREEEEPVTFDLLGLCNRGSVGDAVTITPGLEIKEEIRKLDKIDRKHLSSRPQHAPSETRKTTSTTSKKDSAPSLSCEGHSMGLTGRINSEGISEESVHHKDQESGIVTEKKTEEEEYSSSHVANLARTSDGSGVEPLLLDDVAKSVARICIQQSETGANSTEQSEGAPNILKQDDSTTKDNTFWREPHQESHPDNPPDKVPEACDLTNTTTGALIDNVEFFSARSTPVISASPEPASSSSTSASAALEEDAPGLMKITNPDNIPKTETASAKESSWNTSHDKPVAATSFSDENDLKLYTGEKILSEVQGSIKMKANALTAVRSEIRDISDNSAGEVKLTTATDCHRELFSDLGPGGVQSRNVAVETTNKKAELLMELIDKRESLTQQKLGIISQRASGGTSHKPMTSPNKNSKQETLKVSGSGSTSVSQRSTKSSKLTKDSIMANIIRAKEQSSRLKNPDGEKLRKSKLKQERTGPKQPKLSSLDLIRHTLREWKTVQTVHFLTGSNQQGHDHDFEGKYTELCGRVDAQELSGMLDEDKMDDEAPTGKLPSMQQLESDSQNFEVRVQEFYGNKSSVDVLRVQAKKPEQPKSGKPTIEEKPLREPIVPLVDSVSQNTHRRKIVLDKLNRGFPELLGPLRISVTEFTSELKQLVKSFNLSSTNILLKPPEWTLMSYFLLKLLAIVCPSIQRALRGDVATHYFRTMLLSLNITESDVNDFVEEMCSHENQ